MLGAKLDQIPGWCCDLNCAAEIGETAWALRNQNPAAIKAIKRGRSLNLTQYGRTVILGIGYRPVWMAIHVHEHELSRIAGVHCKLKESLPQLLMFIAPHSPKQIESAICHLHNCGLKTQIWAPDTALCTFFS